jgi:hypothetical protein
MGKKNAQKSLKIKKKLAGKTKKIAKKNVAGDCFFKEKKRKSAAKKR